MFGVEILLLTILIITITIYKKNWVPVYPHFYSTKKLVRIGHRGAPSLAHENTWTPSGKPLMLEWMA